MTALGGLLAFLLLGNAVLGAMPAHATAPAVPDYTVALTAYNAVPEQTDGDPSITASGAFSNPEVVAARSRDLAEELPFGTIVEVVGAPAESNSCGYNIVAPIIGYRVIADSMNARYTDRLDILFSTKANYLMGDGSTKNAGTILGICQGASVRVVGRIDLSHPGRLPKTQEELATLVNSTKSAPLSIK